METLGVIVLIAKLTRIISLVKEMNDNLGNKKIDNAKMVDASTSPPSSQQLLNRLTLRTFLKIDLEVLNVSLFIKEDIWRNKSTLLSSNATNTSATSLIRFQK